MALLCFLVAKVTKNAFCQKLSVRAFNLGQSPHTFARHDHLMHRYSYLILPKIMDAEHRFINLYHSELPAQG